MDTTDTSQNVPLTCPVCNVTLSQPQGTRRTICPYCGNFYDSNTLNNDRLLGSRPVPSQHPAPTPPSNGRVRGGGDNKHGQETPQRNQHLPSLNNKEESDGIRGGFQSLANFFQNLGSRQSSNSHGSGPSRNKSNRGHSSSTNHSSEGNLPPIARDGKGRLTTGSNTPATSPRPHKHDVHKEHSRSRTLSGSHSNITAGKFLTTERLRCEVNEAYDTGNWTEVTSFYSSTFESFNNINLAFKHDPSKEYKSSDDSGLRLDFVYSVYDILDRLPDPVKKVVLKAFINSLLKDRRLNDLSRQWPHTRDELRAYLVLVLNPQFNGTATYVIFAHLLRQMAALSDHDHHYLVHWFRKVEMKYFHLTVQRLHNFISCRLFPPKPQDLPPMAKCSWWIPSATKVLALLNAGNNLCNPPLISHMEFYNSTLDHLDLMAEYYTWQNPTSHPGFSFCQYPFILSIAAKRNILQRDSEQQMIIMARRSLVAKVQRRQMPDIGMLFLNLTVRRPHLVSDSLNEIARKQHDLKKKLKVTFAGEPGLDMGGLTKEWFLLLVRQIFQPEYGMFYQDIKSRVFWFTSTRCDSYQEFNLVGVLMGLAVYNSIILDIHFPPVCYRKLLSPAVVPYNNPRATVGITPVTLPDLEQTLPDLAHGLRELQEYEGDVEDDLCMTFQISFTEMGSTRTHCLKPGGENIPVTNGNRKEYVQLYCDYLLNKAIYAQFQAFYHGFHSVCASNALIMLRPEEVELLVCGHPNLDMAELRKVTKYDGYTQHDTTVRLFWETVLALSLDIQKRLLLFCTGSDRVPIGGMSEMTFKITKVDNIDMLPMAHTCFNQLVLPPYKTKKLLKQKLLIAVQNAEGFGLE